MKKFITVLFLLLATTTFAFAQAPDVSRDTPKPDISRDTPAEAPKVFPKIQNPLNKDFSDIPSLINGVVDLALRLGVIVAVLALVWVGFKFIIAQGNPGEIDKAKQALWWVIIGIFILFSSKIVIEIIKGTLNNFVDPTKIKIN